MNSSFHGDMHNAVVRMVVPMRREFGCALDVQRMRGDRAYAATIVEQALGSHVESLRDCARLVGFHLSTTAAAQDGPRPPTERTLPSPESIAHNAALAARQLIDLVGPAGEALAIRIEGAPDAQALAPLIELARTRIAGVRGETAARNYMRRTAHVTTRRAAPAAPRNDAATLRRDASRAACELVALVGTFGEELAERIENSHRADELAALIAEARDGITAVVGAAAAKEFAERVQPGRR